MTTWEALRDFGGLRKQTSRVPPCLMPPTSQKCHNEGGELQVTDHLGLGGVKAGRASCANTREPVVSLLCWGGGPLPSTCDETAPTWACICPAVTRLWCHIHSAVWDCTMATQAVTLCGNGAQGTGIALHYLSGLHTPASPSSSNKRLKNES